MLSRTAENLFWLSRYIERAEFLARTIEAALSVAALPNAYVAETNEWDTVLLTSGVSAGFHEIHQEADEPNVLEFLAFSPDNPSSIRNCLEKAWLNSRAACTVMTSEMWEAIDGAWADFQAIGDKRAGSREEMMKFLRFVQESALRFGGLADRTMLRNDGYWFWCLGLHLERADNTARLLHVKYQALLPDEEQVGGLLDYYQWTSMLQSVSALTAYRRLYRESMKPWLIAELLILNDLFPCSLANCYSNLVRNLDRIGLAYGRPGASQRHARGIRNRLEHTQLDDIFQQGVPEFTRDFMSDNATLGEIIAKQYLI